MAKKVKYMKCPNPSYSCMDCPHRGKHAFIDGKCDKGDCGRCVPYNPAMNPAVMLEEMTIYQCPNCKTIRGVRTLTPPKCPECDNHD
jgi:hypothetical protein